MPYIQLDDQQYPLRPGALRVGAGADADVRLPGPEGGAVQAMVELALDGHTSIRRLGSASLVRVNGVALGAEPTPLIHGDKIEIGGHELTFADDKRAGSTQFISPAKLHEYQKGRGKPPSRPTVSSGGRLVSLVDGREYAVPSKGLNIGRDAACDVVVPSTEVSRNHAEISPAAGGYIVIDTSSNGVWVNGERIEGTHLLGRGDVVRVGNEEFRFYADMAPAPEAAPAPKSVAAAAAPARMAPPPASAPAHPAAVAAAAQRAPSPAPHEERTPGGRPARILASLEILNEGVLKGHRYEIRMPLTHIGRGEHNDVIVENDSVSDSHAKIQKREAGWFVVDMGSTNGTYVGGRRIEGGGEAQLVGAPDVRFGGVKMVFRPAADSLDGGKGTRAIAGVSVDQARRAVHGGGSAAGPAAPKTLTPASEAPKSGIPIWVWIAAIILIVIAGFFILQGS